LQVAMAPTFTMHAQSFPQACTSAAAAVLES
jgi:hypothetical protein